MAQSGRPIRILGGAEAKALAELYEKWRKTQASSATEVMNAEDLGDQVKADISDSKHQPTTAPQLTLYENIHRDLYKGNVEENAKQKSSALAHYLNVASLMAKNADYDPAKSLGTVVDALKNNSLELNFLPVTDNPLHEFNRLKDALVKAYEKKYREKLSPSEVRDDKKDEKKAASEKWTEQRIRTHLETVFDTPSAIAYQNTNALKQFEDKLQIDIRNKAPYANLLAAGLFYVDESKIKPHDQPTRNRHLQIAQESFRSLTLPAAPPALQKASMQVVKLVVQEMRATLDASANLKEDRDVKLAREKLNAQFVKLQEATAQGLVFPELTAQIQTIAVHLAELNKKAEEKANQRAVETAKAMEQLKAKLSDVFSKNAPASKVTALNTIQDNYARKLGELNQLKGNELTIYGDLLTIAVQYKRGEKIKENDPRLQALARLPIAALRALPDEPPELKNASQQVLKLAAGRLEAHAKEELEHKHAMDAVEKAAVVVKLEEEQQKRKAEEDKKRVEEKQRQEEQRQADEQKRKEEAAAELKRRDEEAKKRADALAAAEKVKQDTFDKDVKAAKDTLRELAGKIRAINTEAKAVPIESKNIGQRTLAENRQRGDALINEYKEIEQKLSDISARLPNDARAQLEKRKTEFADKRDEANKALTEAVANGERLLTEARNHAQTEGKKLDDELRKLTPLIRAVQSENEMDERKKAAYEQQLETVRVNLNAQKGNYSAARQQLHDDFKGESVNDKIEKFKQLKDQFNTAIAAAMARANIDSSVKSYEQIRFAKFDEKNIKQESQEYQIKLAMWEGAQTKLTKEAKAPAEITRAATEAKAALDERKAQINRVISEDVNQLSDAFVRLNNYIRDELEKKTDATENPRIGPNVLLTPSDKYLNKAQELRADFEKLISQSEGLLGHYIDNEAKAELSQKIADARKQLADAEERIGIAKTRSDGAKAKLAEYVTFFKQSNMAMVNSAVISFEFDDAKNKANHSAFSNRRRKFAEHFNNIANSDKHEGKGVILLHTHRAFRDNDGTDSLMPLKDSYFKENKEAIANYQEEGKFENSRQSLRQRVLRLHEAAKQLPTDPIVPSSAVIATMDAAMKDLNERMLAVNAEKHLPGWQRNYDVLHDLTINQLQQAAQSIKQTRIRRQSAEDKVTAFITHFDRLLGEINAHVPLKTATDGAGLIINDLKALSTIQQKFTDANGDPKGAATALVALLPPPPDTLRRSLEDKIITLDHRLRTLQQSSQAALATALDNELKTAENNVNLLMSNWPQAQSKTGGGIVSVSNPTSGQVYETHKATEALAAKIQDVDAAAKQHSLPNTSPIFVAIANIQTRHQAYSQKNNLATGRWADLKTKAGVHDAQLNTSIQPLIANAKIVDDYYQRKSAAKIQAGDLKNKLGQIATRVAAEKQIIDTAEASLAQFNHHIQQANALLVDAPLPEDIQKGWQKGADPYQNPYDPGFTVRLDAAKQAFNTQKNQHDFNAARIPFETIEAWAKVMDDELAHPPPSPEFFKELRSNLKAKQQEAKKHADVFLPTHGGLQPDYDKLQKQFHRLENAYRNRFNYATAAEKAAEERRVDIIKRHIEIPVIRDLLIREGIHLGTDESAIYRQLNHTPPPSPPRPGLNVWLRANINDEVKDQKKLNHQLALFLYDRSKANDPGFQCDAKYYAPKYTPLDPAIDTKAISEQREKVNDAYAAFATVPNVDYKNPDNVDANFSIIDKATSARYQTTLENTALRDVLLSRGLHVDFVVANNVRLAEIRDYNYRTSSCYDLAKKLQAVLINPPTDSRQILSEQEFARIKSYFLLRHEPVMKAESDQRIKHLKDRVEAVKDETKELIRRQKYYQLEGKGVYDFKGNQAILTATIDNNIARLKKLKGEYELLEKTYQAFKNDLGNKQDVEGKLHIPDGLEMKTIETHRQNADARLAEINASKDAIEKEIKALNALKESIPKEYLRESQKETSFARSTVRPLTELKSRLDALGISGAPASVKVAELRHKHTRARDPQVTDPLKDASEGLFHEMNLRKGVKGIIGPPAIPSVPPVNALIVDDLATNNNVRSTVYASAAMRNVNTFAQCPILPAIDRQERYALFNAMDEWLCKKQYSPTQEHIYEFLTSVKSNPHFLTLQPGFIECFGNDPKVVNRHAVSLSTELGAFADSGRFTMKETLWSMSKIVAEFHAQRSEQPVTYNALHTNWGIRGLAPQLILAGEQTIPCDEDIRLAKVYVRNAFEKNKNLMEFDVKEVKRPSFLKALEFEVAFINMQRTLCRWPPSVRLKWNNYSGYDKPATPSNEQLACYYEHFSTRLAPTMDERFSKDFAGEFKMADAARGSLEKKAGELRDETAMDTPTKLDKPMAPIAKMPRTPQG